MPEGGKFILEVRAPDFESLRSERDRLRELCEEVLTWDIEGPNRVDAIKWERRYAEMKGEK